MNEPRYTALGKTREALIEAGYRTIGYHEIDNGGIWLYTNGAEVLLLKLMHERGSNYVDGFDVYVPLVSTNSVQDTIDAIKARSKVAA